MPDSSSDSINEDDDDGILDGIFDESPSLCSDEESYSVHLVFERTGRNNTEISYGGRPKQVLTDVRFSLERLHKLIEEVKVAVFGDECPLVSEPADFICWMGRGALAGDEYHGTMDVTFRLEDSTCLKIGKITDDRVEWELYDSNYKVLCCGEVKDRGYLNIVARFILKFLRGYSMGKLVRFHRN